MKPHLCPTRASIHPLLLPHNGSTKNSLPPTPHPAPTPPSPDPRHHSSTPNLFPIHIFHPIFFPSTALPSFPLLQANLPNPHSTVHSPLFCTVTSLSFHSSSHYPPYDDTSLQPSSESTICSKCFRCPSVLYQADTPIFQLLSVLAANSSFCPLPPENCLQIPQNSYLSRDLQPMTDCYRD